MKPELGLIFQEGPIARSFLEVLLLKKIKINNLYYLDDNKYFFRKLSSKIKSYYVNSFAIKFLSKKKNIQFIKKIESHFCLNENFFKDMYLIKPKDIFKYNLKYVGKSVNSNKFIKILKKDNNEILLNTSNKIYKEILNYKKNILHIHPGFLPNIRGADASLWSVLKLNCYSSSAIYINEKIDEGKILYREKLLYKKFKLDIYYDNSDLKKIWFSFVDPAIRSCNLIKLIEKRILSSRANIENNDGTYYSFMKNNDKIGLLKKILL